MAVFETISEPKPGLLLIRCTDIVVKGEYERMFVSPYQYKIGDEFLVRKRKKEFGWHDVRHPFLDKYENFYELKYDKCNKDKQF